MKKKNENQEQDKMLNQDRFGFFKESMERYEIKPRISPLKNMGGRRDLGGGAHKDN